MGLSELACRLQGNIFSCLEEKLGKELVTKIPIIEIPEKKQKIKYPWKEANDLEYDVVKFVTTKSQKTGLAIRYEDIKTNRLCLEIIIQKNPKESDWENVKREKKNSICKDKVVSQENFEVIKGILNGESIEKTDGKFLPSNRQGVFSQFFKRKFEFFNDLPIKIINKLPEKEAKELSEKKIKESPKKSRNKGDIEQNFPKICDNVKELIFDGVRGVLPNYMPFMLIRYFDINHNQKVVAQITSIYNDVYLMAQNMDESGKTKNKKMIDSLEQPNNRQYFKICFYYEDGRASEPENLKVNHITKFNDLFAGKSLEETKGIYLPCLKDTDAYTAEKIEHYLKGKKSPKDQVKKESLSESG